MPDLSRSQLLVYGAVAVALLLVGARAIRAGEGGGGVLRAGGGQLLGRAAEAQGSAGFSLEGGGPDVVVDVTGAVRRPGVYRLPAGARVTDAVARAGGASRRRGAGSDQPRGAARRRPAGPRPGGAPAGGAPSPAPPPKTARSASAARSVEQLETIDGIGPVTAGDIVEFRDEHGGLASVDQLDQVSRDRPGDDGGAARAPAALSRRCARGRSVAIVLAVAAAVALAPRPQRRDPRARRGGARPGACRRARRRWRGASCSARTRGSTPETVERLPPRRPQPPARGQRPERGAAGAARDAGPGRCSGCRCGRGWSGCSALIAVYVPLTGAGPSIQRAGVMGGAERARDARAGGAPRASTRWPLAAMVTLAIDPGIAADVGWQLSFAAVLGILAAGARRCAAAIARRGSATRRGSAPRAGRGRRR